MPRFSAFNSTHFTSKPSYEEQIYGEMVKALGNGKNYSVDFNSLVAARLYANAMAFGRCKYAIERLGQQFRPTRALENLPLLEHEYGLIPEIGASVAARRAELVVAARLARGASRSNVETVMAELFGADFVAYITNPIAGSVVSPAAPTDSGVYDKPGTQRGAFELLNHVMMTNTPVTFTCRLLAGNGQSLLPGRRFVISSGDYSRQEAVAVESVALSGGVYTVAATFKKAHVRGTILATGRHASQYTSKRENLFVLSAAAASDAQKRRRAHRLARRLLRAISTWSVADESGPFTVNGGRLGITAIGAVS